MKSTLATALLCSFVALTGCATKTATDTQAAGAEPVEVAFEDKGEIITGSRIPQKSTAHSMRRVGSAEYKKMRNENTSSDVPQEAPRW